MMERPVSINPVKNPLSVQDTSFQEQLRSFAQGLDDRQLTWASGYLAGLSAQTSLSSVPVLASDTADATAAATNAPPNLSWQIFYATETGNSRSLAQQLAGEMASQGIGAELVDLCDYRPRQLKQETHAVFVLATHGLGDAPAGTEEFFEYLLEGDPGSLPQLSYSVLALGDSSYADFCEVGRQVDARLQALGAQQIVPRIDCDVDFDVPAANWQSQVIHFAVEEVVIQKNEERKPGESRKPTLVSLDTPTWTRSQPFPARVLKNHALTGRDSSKQVSHLVLDLEGSHLRYQPGDALGVWPENSAAIVDPIIELLELDPESSVEIDGDRLTLRQALTHRLELTQVAVGLAQDYADQFQIEALQRLLYRLEREELASFVSERQVIDLFVEFPLRRAEKAAPGNLSAQKLVDLLRKLTPRLYSIASSIDANPDEAHLTVSLVDYIAWGRPHFGSASSYLGGLSTGSDQGAERVKVYVVANPRFRLPENDEAPLIMIGAGTGIAPFRGFLEERQLRQATGHNWLFFGDRNFRSDFLYQTEWARLRKSGLLTRHDVAFSRDQAEKIYVQDRIRERAADLLNWIDRGAYLYLCGDARNFAPAVECALLDVLSHASHSDPGAARIRLDELKKNGRYQRDVY